MSPPVTIRFGSIADTDAIMHFMDRHWREGHILSRSRELLLYEFADGDRLNFALARRGDDLVGLFGFIRYNRRAVPDLAGSLWKVVESETTPLLGLKLRQFVMDNVPHRFFAAPGAGPQTQPIYSVLGMGWQTMTHWYMLNPWLRPEQFRLAKISRLPATPPASLALSPASWTVREVKTASGLETIPFEQFSHTLPFKDRGYVHRRFLEHPIYHYRLWHIHGNGDHALFVTRTATHQGASAIRVVDYYGDECCLPLLGIALRQQLAETQAEYADFIALGLDPVMMERSGFTALDLSREQTIIPNYFEPFEQRNVPIHCVHDPLPEGSVFRMFRADGDQDRPSMLPDEGGENSTAGQPPPDHEAGDEIMRAASTA